MCYRKYNDGFYVKSDKKINNIFEIAKYIGRYLARPAIAEYRITDITDSSVTFWYQKPDSPKKIFLTLPMTQFIGRLLAHIPPKNFKMIRSFGYILEYIRIKNPRKLSFLKAKFLGMNIFLKSLRQVH